MLIGIVATLLAPKTHFDHYSPRNLSEAIIDPFKQFLTRQSALILLLLILLYKLGDAFMAFLMSLCDHHFTATQYALFSALSSGCNPKK